ncbi:MAG: hypothetical protein Q4A66_10710, partial [Eubacteriales bacterium]|nr:hypothetical protein [Eubacteriales bacterium]
MRSPVSPGRRKADPYKQKRSPPVGATLAVARFPADSYTQNTRFPCGSKQSDPSRCAISTPL